MDQILGYNRPQSQWVTVGRWSLGALVVALGWTVLGASTSAHAADEPTPGLLGSTSEVTTTLTYVTTTITTPVAAAPAAVVPAVTSAAAPLASAVATTIGATAPLVTPITPVPAIVFESVTASTPRAVETLVTTIAGTPLISAVTSPVGSVVTSLEGTPVVGPGVLTPILDSVRPVTDDLPSACSSLLGSCVSVPVHAVRDALGPASSSSGSPAYWATDRASSTTSTWWGPATRLHSAATDSSAATTAIAANVGAASPKVPGAPAAPSGLLILAPTTSVNANGGSAGAPSATLTTGLEFHAEIADAPHGHSAIAHSAPADDPCSSPD